MWGQANDLGMSFNIFKEINNHWENESFNSICFENLAFIVIREKMGRLPSSQSQSHPAPETWRQSRLTTDIATHRTLADTQVTHVRRTDWENGVQCALPCCAGLADVKVCPR